MRRHRLALLVWCAVTDALDRVSKALEFTLEAGNLNGACRRVREALAALEEVGAEIRRLRDSYAAVRRCLDEAEGVHARLRTQLAEAQEMQDLYARALRIIGATHLGKAFCQEYARAVVADIRESEEES